MKSLKRIVGGMCAFFGVVQVIFAQVDPTSYGYYANAHEFSKVGNVGSARVRGMGGVQTAIGGDGSTMAVNPAGLGVFRHHHFGVTANVQLAGTTTEYFTDVQNDETNSYRLGLNLPSIDVVFADTDDSPSNSIKSQAFGISYNRVYNYRNKFNFSGQNNETDMRELFLEQANGNYVPADFYYYDDYLGTDEPDLYNPVSLAYHSFLLQNYYDENGKEILNDQYFSIDYGSSVRQDETVKTTGNKGIWNIGYGFNYKHVANFGIAIGVPRVTHKVERSYTETLSDRHAYNLKDFTMNETFTTEGTGMNLRIGTNISFGDYVKLGASVQTATIYWFKESYKASMQTKYFNNEIFINDSVRVNLPSNNYDLSTNVDISNNYNLKTPMQANGGLAFFFKKHGFISADIEYVPFNNTRVFSSGLESYKGDNNTIKNLYANALNYKFGGELRLDQFMIRAGYSIFGNTLNKGIVNNQATSYSFGVGYKAGANRLDFAIVNTNHKSGYSPYVLNNGSGPSAVTKNTLTEILLSYGVVF